MIAVPGPLPMGDNWYRFGDQPPPLVVKVRVAWSGRIFIAARGRGKDGEERWGEYRPGSDRPRPVELSGSPDLWQPLHPELWRLPLPEPVTLSADGIMAAERVSFALVDAAEASDLAREMEADRAHANGVSRENRVAQPEKERSILWWRDASLIRYERAPDITLRMVEGRLMRAVYHSGAADHGGVQTSSVLRDMSEAAARALAELEAKSTPDFVPRMDSTPADAGDFLTAMGWFAALNPPDPNARPRRLLGWFGALEGFDYIPAFNQPQMIILRRAQNIPLSFDEIGIELFHVDPTGRDAARRIHAAGERARLMFKGAVSSCWKLAMGLTEPASNRVMAAVRQRNREAKRRAMA